VAGVPVTTCVRVEPVHSIEATHQAGAKEPPAKGCRSTDVHVAVIFVSTAIRAEFTAAYTPLTHVLEQMAVHMTDIAVWCSFHP